MNTVQDLEAKVNVFNGLKVDKEYKYLEEMLTRCLIQLDAVEAGDHDKIRQARKQAVRMIQTALDLLELKAQAYAQNNEQQTELSADSSSSENRVDDNNSKSMETDESGNTGNQTQVGESREATGGDSMETGDSGKGMGKGKKDDRAVKEMQLDSEVAC